MSILLSGNSNPGNCTVTICHSQTKCLKEICLQGDIIVAAIGTPEFLKAEMVKEGAVIIDVGITRVEDKSRKSVEGMASLNWLPAMALYMLQEISPLEKIFLITQNKICKGQLIVASLL